MQINILMYPIFLPILAGAFLFIFPKRLEIVRGLIALLTAAGMLVFAFMIFTTEPAEYNFTLLELGSFKLDMHLLVSVLGKFSLLLISVIGVLIALYSLPFMRRNAEKRTAYYPFFLFALGGSAGVVLANHFILFLISWEIVTASLYFLLSAGKPESKTGASKTFALLGASDGSLLLGIGLFWAITRSFSMEGTAIPLKGWMPVLYYLFILLAALTKAGSMPLHTWIPSAGKDSPASAMAFLPAAVDKFLGIYLLIRISTSLFAMTSSMGMVLMIIGSVTIITAVMAAMVQHDMKRLFSYHAVSQVGYVVLGIGTMNPLGIAGAILHMVNNSIFKSCLFLGAGAVEQKTGTTDLSKLGGLSRVMPVTYITSLVCVLSISGIPLFNGFVSKWMIYQGTISSGSSYHFIFLVAAMFGSALTLASFVKVMYSVFLGRKTEHTKGVKNDVSVLMLIPMILLSALCLVIGIAYKPVLSRFIYPLVQGQVSFTGIWEAPLALLFVGIGIIAGLIIFLMGRVKKKARIVPPYIGGEEVNDSMPRLSGAEFYTTVKNLPVLKGVYLAQEKERFDLHFLFGKCGAAITFVLRKLHNGLLSRYLLWGITGTVVLLILALIYL